MKKLIVCLILFAGTFYYLNAEPPEKLTAIKCWINGERLSFRGDSIYLLEEMIKKSNIFYIIYSPIKEKVVKVYELKAPEQYYITDNKDHYLFDAKKDSLCMALIDTPPTSIKKEIFPLHKNQGFSFAETRHHEPVLVIYDKKKLKKRAPR